MAENNALMKGIQEIILWAKAHDLHIPRIKIGNVEVEFERVTPLDIAKPEKTSEDSGVTRNELPDPDGPVTTALLNYSSGFEEPEEEPQE